MKVFKTCEKKAGEKGRCAKWPKCEHHDWWDRPVREDGTRPWVRLEDSALLSHTDAVKLAMKKRLKHANIAQGLEPKPKAPAPLLSKYIPVYEASDRVKAHRTAKKTKTILDDFLAHILAHFGDRPINQITAAMINHWRDALEQRPSKKTGGTWSQNSVQCYTNAVMGLFDYASDEDEDLAEVELENPCDKLRRRSEARPRACSGARSTTGSSSSWTTRSTDCPR